MKVVVSPLLAAALLTAPAAARAQQYQPSASAMVGSGVESGGYGARRARTRLRAALELRTDERPDEALVVAGDVDVEPKPGFGADVRYGRALGPTLTLSAGAIGYLVPGTLIGPCAGAEARLPMGKGAFAVVAPDVSVFVAGSDLPENTVVWQALFQVGLRASFF
jgi:hypothetical protein